MVGAWAKGEDVNTVEPAILTSTFTLLRRATWGTTVSATPTPVKKGKTITVKGTLKRVDWKPKNKPYVAFPKKAVLLQFQAAGTTTWTTVQTVKTGATGKVSATAKATKSGSWRLRFAGMSTTSSSNSAANYIKVN